MKSHDIVPKQETVIETKTISVLSWHFKRVDRAAIKPCCKYLNNLELEVKPLDETLYSYFFKNPDEPTQTVKEAIQAKSYISDSFYFNHDFQML